jgi:hypothetical protein
MRKSFAVTVAGVIAALATTVFGDQSFVGPSASYTDAVGDIDPGISTGNGTLDILGMEVSNTLTDITFKLTVNGNVSTTDWGKFMIGIATQKTDGTLSGNGWGRPINLSYDNDPFAAQIVGMNHWIGSWVDGSSVQAPIGGAEFYTYDNGSSTWTRNAATWDAGTYPYPYTVTSGAQSTAEWSFPLSLMSLVPGNVIYFDAYSSGGGGGDSAIDSLANPNVSVTGWGGPYTSYTTALGGPGLNAYTVAVPEPSSIAAVSLSGAAIGLQLLRRRRVS